MENIIYVFSVLISVLQKMKSSIRTIKNGLSCRDEFRSELVNLEGWCK